jgi:septum site-determining protein MinC
MVLKSQTQIQIKGIREGLLVTIGDGDWLEIQRLLLEQIKEKGKFFQGAKLAVDVGNRIVHAGDLSGLRDRLSDFEIALWAILSNSSVTEQTAQDLGMATKISVPIPERKINSLETTIAGDDAIFVQKTVRSGFKIATHAHVVVLGDVNPGGEIIAGGSIVVWGHCRGIVHAGADGNEKAVICALDLAPTQLRIAGLIAVSPKGKGKPQPEVASIVSGQVVAETWNLKTR